MLNSSATLVICSHVWFILVLYQTLHNVSLIISHPEFRFTVPLHYTLAKWHDDWIQLHMFCLYLCEVCYCCMALWTQSVNNTPKKFNILLSQNLYFIITFRKNSNYLHIIKNILLEGQTVCNAAEGLTHFNTVLFLRILRNCSLPAYWVLSISRLLDALNNCLSFNTLSTSSLWRKTVLPPSHMFHLQSYLRYSGEIWYWGLPSYTNFYLYLSNITPTLHTAQT